ncbi:hypothetical protein [Gimesia algae]|uniref:Uncharacterized protein n=1 Tax=Gimesia algae TaxID=2527971 RepID=A0A517V9J9_9PLAN|nr:hypothetical protein [Gimesia algae]QDT89677.1 hypothetical protein Pan161_13090 [Gimesia algae]
MTLYQRIFAILISVAAVVFLCGAPGYLMRYLDEETELAIYFYGLFVILLSTSILLLVYSVCQMIVIGSEYCRTQVKLKPGEQNSDR